MKQFETNGHRCLVVDVPDGTLYFDIGFGGADVICIGEYVETGYIKTPPGNWQIVGTGTADKITEQEWGEVVEVCEDEISDYRHLFYDYEKKEWSADDKTESGHSLLKSQGYENLSEIVLLKKIQ
jgi:hypothetical protein